MLPTIPKTARFVSIHIRNSDLSGIFTIFKSKLCMASQKNLGQSTYYYRLWAIMRMKHEGCHLNGNGVN